MVAKTGGAIVVLVSVYYLPQGISLFFRKSEEPLKI
jgi:hypothetical protein